MPGVPGVPGVPGMAAVLAAHAVHGLAGVPGVPELPACHQYHNCFRNPHNHVVCNSRSDPSESSQGGAGGGFETSFKQKEKGLRVLLNKMDRDLACSARSAPARRPVK